jgi:NhaP-type Na+/H+ or K+/H+ antiporter
MEQQQQQQRVDAASASTTPSQEHHHHHRQTKDATRDKTCREYLFHFLNGTTDARDECVGFYNAWQAADCQEQSSDDDDETTTNDPKNKAAFMTHPGETAARSWYEFWHLLGLDHHHHNNTTNTNTTTTTDNDNTNNNKINQMVFGNQQRTLEKTNGTTDDDVAIDDYYENWECCSSITDFYAKHCRQQSNEHNAFQLLGVTLGLVICGVSKSLLKVSNLSWIPDAGACIIVGSIMGGTMRLLVPQFTNALIFDNDLFLQILLPPIIFEASLSINKKAFRRDLFPILTLAIFGTFFSALAIGYGTYYLSAWWNGSGNNDSSLPLVDALVFGALMSSIDPVATLSILSSNGVNPRDTLYNLIFGESLLNDGVAIVLFNSLVRHVGGGDHHSDAAHPTADTTSVVTLHDVWRDFITVTVSSLAIGVTCGAVCTLYFCALRGQHTAVTEVAMFFTWALIPYYIADGLECSGIIAIMVMGFMLDYYVVGSDSLARRLAEEEQGRALRDSGPGRWVEYMETHHPPVPTAGGRRDARSVVRAFLARAFSGKGHIDGMSRHHVGFVAHVIANLMETAIFGYLGLFLFNDKSLHHVPMLVSGLFSCIASRAVMVAGASLIINVFVFLDVEDFLGRLWHWIRHNRRLGGSNSNNNNRISLSEDDVPERLFLDRTTQLILFSAGVRGAVSYALVQNIPVYNAVTKHGSKFKTELRAMTSTSIVVLIFGFGAMTYYLIQRNHQQNRTGSRGLDRTAVSGHHHNALTDQLLLSEFSSPHVPAASDDGGAAEFHPVDDDDNAEYQQHPGLNSTEAEANHQHQHFALLPRQ